MLVSLKKLVGKLNPTTRSALEAAAGLCVSRTHYDIEIEHFLLKLLDLNGADLDLIVKSFAIDRSRLNNELLRSLDRLKSGNSRSPAFSPYIVKAMIQAWTIGSIEYGAAEIRTGFIIAALVGDDELSKLVREFSSELRKIDAKKLLQDYSAIVRGSTEDNLVLEPSESDNEREPKRGPRVFISYRHDDSSFYADFIFTCLRAEVPDVRVFRDSDTLKPGMVFSEKIVETVAACDILLAVMGRKWFGTQGDVRRIDLADDWVRLEVAAALQQQKMVIPCLVGGAKMPDKDALPADIAGLALRHAVRISQNDLRRDLDELIERLRTWHGSTY
jgi:hypothetical protein